jgi:death on curing protein
LAVWPRPRRERLARNHAFVDGNKRTAWAAAWTFLHLNGVGLAVDFDVDDAEAFMNQVATDADLAVDVVASKLSTYAISSQ